jgi:ADP-heptose:LPS heptosyltransferase
MVNKYRNILVIQTASIGDVILVTPVIEELHALYPEASIDILVKKGTETLFDGHPFLRKVWIWDKSSSKYPNVWRLIIRLRRQKYDLCINAQRFFSSGMISVFSGARVTSGFNKNPLSFLYSYKIKHDIGKDHPHEAERNLALIPGYQVLEGSANISLYPRPEDYSHVVQYKQEQYICISPASLWFTKQFPLEKWLELIQEIPLQYRIYLLGSESDHNMAEELITGSRRDKITNLCGKMGLLQSAALMKDAVMNYVNDSAPLHLCSAVKAPVTAVFCSTVPSFGFGPYGGQGRVVEISRELACRPCGIHGKSSCPEKHFLCAFNITKEQLLSTLP